MSDKEKRVMNNARKKLNESKETQFDVAFKNALATFRAIDIDMSEKITKFSNRSISKNRINLYLKANYITKTDITIKDKVYKNIIMLTKSGERFVKRLENRCKDITYKSNSIEHDYCQADYIINKQTEFSIDEIRNYYKSESELEKCKINALESRTDGAFIFDDDRQNVYIETTTQHYKDHVKLAKSAYAHNRGGRYIEHRVTL